MNLHHLTKACDNDDDPMLLIIKRTNKIIKKMLPDQHQRYSDSKMQAFFSSPFSVALAWDHNPSLPVNVKCFQCQQPKNAGLTGNLRLRCRTKAIFLRDLGAHGAQGLAFWKLLVSAPRGGGNQEVSEPIGWKMFSASKHEQLSTGCLAIEDRSTAGQHTMVSFVFSTTSFSVLAWPLSFRNFLASADVGFPPPTLSHGIGLLHQHQFRQDAWSNSNVHPFHQETSMPDISCCGFCCLIAHIDEIYKIQTKHKKTRSLWKGGALLKTLGQKPKLFCSPWRRLLHKQHKIP